MKPKTMILMIVAVTCGLGASYMTSRLLAERGDDAQEKVDVLVAKKKLNLGEIVKKPEECFEIKKVNKGEEQKDALTSAEGLKDKMMNRMLRAGDVVRQEDVTKDTSLAEQLPDGYRAIGIRVNMHNTAGGFSSLPRSRVDIIVTMRRGDDKTTFSGVLLEDVLVLAADTSTVREEGKSSMPANVVTVALKPEDLVSLQLAENQGTLSLALRRPGEKRSEQLAKVTMEQLFTGTAGKSDRIEEGSSFGSELPIAQIPMNPVVPPKAEIIQIPQNPVVVETPKPQTVQVEEPKHKTHRVTVINNDRQVVWEYTLDENDNVINRRQVMVAGKE